MLDSAIQRLISGKYDEAFGVSFTPDFSTYMSRGEPSGSGAALGYRRADCGPLFLESYLDAPIEDYVSAVFGCGFDRAQIVEIGNFASCSAMAMVELWGAAANDLADRGKIAVATLTAPLRRMFSRIGVPFVEISPALRERLGGDPHAWGSYYRHDPRVCAGVIAEGQKALSVHFGRRNRSAAA